MLIVAKTRPWISKGTFRSNMTSLYPLMKGKLKKNQKKARAKSAAFVGNRKAKMHSGLRKAKPNTPRIKVLGHPQTLITALPSSIPAPPAEWFPERWQKWRKVPTAWIKPQSAQKQNYRSRIKCSRSISEQDASDFQVRIKPIIFFWRTLQCYFW